MNFEKPLENVKGCEIVTEMEGIVEPKGNSDYYAYRVTFGKNARKGLNRTVFELLKKTGLRMENEM